MESQSSHCQTRGGELRLERGGSEEEEVWSCVFCRFSCLMKRRRRRKLGEGREICKALSGGKREVRLFPTWLKHKLSTTFVRKGGRFANAAVKASAVTAVTAAYVEQRRRIKWLRYNKNHVGERSCRSDGKKPLAMGNNSNMIRFACVVCTYCTYVCTVQWKEGEAVVLETTQWGNDTITTASIGFGREKSKWQRRVALGIWNFRKLQQARQSKSIWPANDLDLLQMADEDGRWQTIN